MTIITHAPEGHVQLADGIYSAEQVAAIVPEESRGIIDLVMCASLETGRLLRERRGRLSAVKLSEREVDLDRAVILYCHTIRLLELDDLDYITAAAIAATEGGFGLDFWRNHP